MDTRIEGPVRERMLITYYRYKGGSDTHRSATLLRICYEMSGTDRVYAAISAVCNLCRSTGFSPVQTKRPPKYPGTHLRACCSMSGTDLA
eukprot:3230373-Rhodomonas_salina.5